MDEKWEKESWKDPKEVIVEADELTERQNDLIPYFMLC